MKEEQQLTYIQDYIDGRLNPEQVMSFEKRIASDPDFANEYRIQKELSNHFNNKINDFPVRDEELEKQLRDFVRSDKGKQIEALIQKESDLFFLKKNKESFKPNRKVFYRVAAVLLLLCGLGYIFYNANNNNPKDLYLSYYSVEDLPNLIERSVNSYSLNKGIVKFKNKEYLDALTDFKLYKENTSNYNPSVLLYEGISLTELNEYSEAQTVYKSFIALNTIDQPKGYWFLGLLHLREGNREEALKCFQKLKEQTSRYKPIEVEDLIEELVQLNNF